VMCGNRFKPPVLLIKKTLLIFYVCKDTGGNEKGLKKKPPLWGDPKGARRGGASKGATEMLDKGPQESFQRVL